MIAHALTTAGADPAFLLGGELPGAGPGGAPANADWGSSRLDRRRGRRERRQLPEARPRGGGRHQRRARPPLALGRGGGADRRVRAVRGDRPRRSSGRPARGSRALDGAGPVLGFAVAPPAGSGPRSGGGAARDRRRRRPRAAAGSGSSPRRSASARSGSRSRVATTSPTRPPRSGRWPARSSSTSGCRALDDLIAALETFPGMARRLERKGDPRRARSSTTTTPITRPRSPPRWRRCASCPHRRLIAVFQPHLYSRTKALAVPLRPGARAPPTRSGCSTSTRPASCPVGPLEGVSGLDVAAAAADAAPGRRVDWLVDIDRAERVLGDGSARATCSSRSAPATSSGSPTGSCGGGAMSDAGGDRARLHLARLTTVRAGGPADMFARAGSEERLSGCSRIAARSRARG